MWRYYFLVLLTPFTVKGLNDNETKFLIEYFNYRDVKLICILNCDEAYCRREKITRLVPCPLVRPRKVVHWPINNQGCKDCRGQECVERHNTSGGQHFKLDSNEDSDKEEASSSSLFDAQHKWLILVNNNFVSTDDVSASAEKRQEKKQMEQLLRILKSLSISVDSDIVIAKIGHEYQLHDIFNFGKIQGGDFVIKNSGNGQFTNTHENIPGFQTQLNEFKYYRRWDFNQLPMKVISVVSPAPKDFDPSILTDAVPSPSVASITKTSATILEVVSKIHNLRFVHSLGDRWIGDFNVNESQKVIASALYYKQQDLSPAIRLLGDTYDKYDVLHPPVTSIERIKNNVSVFDDNTVETGSMSSARKLTVLVTGISCVLIYNYYTSSVVSWLLNGPPPSINSLEELLDSSLELIFEDIGYTRSWLQHPFTSMTHEPTIASLNHILGYVTTRLTRHHRRDLREHDYP
ncbi:unnamed protein product [Chilo suppressalis]|uniref:Ionotropic receptor 75a N-terminal domain-containing protein n=1 Tax=Chilo suppressalis TaxID=168631 RepID=A0ABN8AYW4_CHISP|nr:unnamed protein product [Chilo suppressalis]